MKDEKIIRRMTFYLQWWKDMDLRERNSETGGWVKERIKLFTEALNDHLRDIPPFKQPIAA